MGESIFKNPTLIGYLVKKIKMKNPKRQVGKTIVQKMMYLLNRKDVIDFDYSMYHYGPYSSEVSGELNFAENSGIVHVNWINDKGYFIDATPKLKKFEKLITEGEKKAIDEIVEGFGSFNAIELSIIATGFFLKDNFGVRDTEVVNVIHQFKQDYTVEFIENIIRKAGIS